MNIQAYWDGNVGATEYSNRRSVFTTKPNIPSVTFDSFAYSEDDNLAIKVQGNSATPLTPEEVAVIKQFANANSVDVATGETFGGAKGVATVWTSEVDLIDKTTFSIPWMYVVGDIADCTDPVDNTVWKSPFRKEYDISVSLGFSGLAPNTNFKAELLKNGNTALITKQFANVLNHVSFDLNRVLLEEGDKLSVRLTFDKAQTCGIMVPSRTYLRVDTTGNVMAKRMADYFFNTLGNMVYYSGVELRLQKDEAQKPAVVADTWTI